MAYLTQEQAIARLIDTHGDRYDYSKVVYKSSAEKIEIICREHSSFWQRFGCHKHGSNCPKCRRNPRITSYQDLIERFFKVHGDKYDYSKVKYINAKAKIIITCGIHGDFKQLASNHVRGDGCPKCASHKYIDTEVKIKKFRSVHGDKYDYSKFKYINATTKAIIICPIHGEFTQTIAHHEKGSGCAFCYERKYTQEFVISKFNELHGNSYDYSLVDYQGKMRKIKIICPTHGIFEQDAREHMRGAGCKKCTYRGWTRTRFRELCDKHNGGKGILYIVKMNGLGESFFKVGITSMSVRKRFAKIKDMPYLHTLIGQYELLANDAYSIEQTIKNILSKQSYAPKVKFKGYTECFSHIPKEVYKLLDSIDKSDQLQLIA